LTTTVVGRVSDMQPDQPREDDDQAAEVPGVAVEHADPKPDPDEVAEPNEPG
jgi:hypothetical protein